MSSFLGLASYFRRFIPGFSRIAKPLHEVSVKKKQTTQPTFHWGSEQNESFIALKDALVQARVLAYPRFDQSFVIEVDASGEGLGACLSQERW